MLPLVSCLFGLAMLTACWSFPQQGTPNNEPTRNSQQGTPAYEEKYFDQILDHFNYERSSNRPDTFKQRYLVSVDHWDKNPSSPILFYCGNEGDIVSFLDNTGFVFELAAEMKGLVVFAEHRYYGKSLPFGDPGSFLPETIGWLSIEQALADYAILIKALKKEYYQAENSSVIAFGGSYGGMLSGYMRYKYPHIIAAAVASSSPFLTVAGHRPRSEFFKTVTETFEMSATGCPAIVQQGFSQMLQAEDGKLEQYFRLCEGQTGKEGFKKQLVGWARNAFTLLAMLDYPYPTNFMAPLPGHPVNLACNYIMEDENKLSGLAKITDLLYGTEEKVTCHDTYTEYVACADPTGCGTGPTNPPWDYQACTEMILPGGSNNVTDMFPELAFTLEQRAEHCMKRFNVSGNRNYWLGTHFWSSLDDIRHASRIIFPNGDLDPWRPGGVLNNLSDDLIAILVKGGAHHLDLRASNKLDPNSVIEARAKISALLKSWIAAP